MKIDNWVQTDTHETETINYVVSSPQSQKGIGLKQRGVIATPVSSNEEYIKSVVRSQVSQDNHYQSLQKIIKSKDASIKAYKEKFEK